MSCSQGRQSQAKQEQQQQDVANQMARLTMGEVQVPTGPKSIHGPHFQQRQTEYIPNQYGTQVSHLSNTTLTMASSSPRANLCPWDDGYVPPSSQTGAPPNTAYAQNQFGSQAASFSSTSVTFSVSQCSISSTKDKTAQSPNGRK